METENVRLKEESGRGRGKPEFWVSPEDPSPPWGRDLPPEPPSQDRGLKKHHELSQF